MSQSPYFPIDKLPLELLNIVFILLCEKKFPLRLFNDSVDPNWGPLTLSHVSSRWRTSARQLRPIWSFIRITDKTPFLKTSLWVELSVNHPLDISIDLNHNRDMPEAYGLLVSHANRWRRFYFHEPGGSYSKRALAIPFLRYDDGSNSHPEPGLSARELTVLDLRRPIPMYGAGMMAPEPCYPLLSCPKLEELFVRYIQLDWDLSGRYLPFCNISDLEVVQEVDDRQQLVQLMTAIGQMKALRHAGIHVTVRPYSDPLDVSEPGQCLMDLPDLRKLKLSFKALCPASWLWMKNLHAPRLEFLAIYLCGPRDQMGSQHWHGEHEQHGWPTLKGVVHSPSLRELSLRLDSGKQCAKCISAFMATVPTVSRMELQLSEWGLRPEPIVRRVLTLECTFPQLENVEVRALRNIMSPENRTLLSSAIARWNPNATVTYVIM